MAHGLRLFSGVYRSILTVSSAGKFSTNSIAFKRPTSVSIGSGINFFYLFYKLSRTFFSKTSALGEKFTRQSDRKIRHLTFRVCMIMQEGVCICSREDPMSIPVIK